jgi:hypothetical protein
MRVTGLIVLVGLLSPTVAPAQSNSYDRAMRAAATLQVLAQRAAPTPPTSIAVDLLAARRFSSRAPGAAFMIFGGAGLLAGILVGGTGGAVLILGGIGVGAYGVYLFTQ